MAENSEKPRVNIGVIGHVDHSKTTLTAAILKILRTRGEVQPTVYDNIDKREISAAKIYFSTAEPHASGDAP